MLQAAKLVEERQTAVQRVVSRYHQAVTDKDVEAALRCLGESHFLLGLGAGSTSDPTLWRAGPFRTRDDMRKWLSEISAYNVTLEFLHTDVRENEAVVVAKETGSGTGADGSTHSWEGVTNLWCLAEIEGDWRIIGSMHHIGE